MIGIVHPALDGKLRTDIKLTVWLYGFMLSYVHIKSFFNFKIQTFALGYIFNTN